MNEVKQVQHDNMKTRRLTRREAKGEYPRVLEPVEIKGMNRKWRLKDAERQQDMRIAMSCCFRLNTSIELTSPKWV